MTHTATSSALPRRKVLVALFSLMLMFVFAAPATEAAPATRGIGIAKKKRRANPYIKGDYWALIIGNNDYKAKKWPQLKTAVIDAKGIAEVLIDRYQFPEENVFLILNGTRRDMLKGFINLKNKAKPDDNVLIYYAGHGEYDEDQRGWWVPVDGEDQIDYISNDDVLGSLRAIKAKHKLLISDSCFSGNLLTRAARKAPSASAPSRYVLEKTKLRSVQGFSSGGNEPVSDGGPQWEGHSIFAFHLLAQLKANQEAYLGAQLLGYKVAKFVANDTASALDAGQTPIFSAIKGQSDQGGEFFFFLPSAAADMAKIGKVAVFYATTEPEFAPVSRGAREVVLQQLASTMESIPINMAGDPMELQGANPRESMVEKMKAANATRAVIVRLSGKRQKQQTLMWQGHLTLTVELQAYKLNDGQLKKIASFKPKPSRLPVRRWAKSPEQVAGQFTKTAKKMAKRTSKRALSGFLARMRE